MFIDEKLCFFVFSCKEMDSTEAFVSPARARSRHPACIPSSSLPEAVAQAPVAFPRRRQTRTRNHGMQQRHFRWFCIFIILNFLADWSLSGSGSADPDGHEQWCYSVLVKAPRGSQVLGVSAENTFETTLTQGSYYVLSYRVKMRCFLLVGFSLRFQSSCILIRIKSSTKHISSQELSSAAVLPTVYLARIDIILFSDFSTRNFWKLIILLAYVNYILHDLFFTKRIF